MTTRSVTHATFVVERTYDAAPARVFAAFADPAIKARWFAGPAGWVSTRHEFDFQVGGREHVVTTEPDGTAHIFDCRYQDIVPNERIVFAYDMYLDQTRVSVSLSTVELKPEGAGTHLILTEQGAFLDGHDLPAGREHGTGFLMDALGAVLHQGAAT